jgi:hypothetical protein
MDCTACHRQQEFCISCHQQMGVARESRLRQPGTALAATRFHPPGFTDLVRSGPNHHSFAAQQNMTSCMGCHTEQTCMQCHAATGSMAQVNPHPRGFATSAFACRSLRQSPLACAKCHGGGSGVLSLRARMAGCQ